MSERIFETKEETLENLKKYCAGIIEEEEEAGKICKLVERNKEVLGINIDDCSFVMMLPRAKESWINIMSEIFCSGYREGLADGYLDGMKDENRIKRGWTKE